MATAFQGYRETPEQIDARWQRIQAQAGKAARPAYKLPELPTLEDCLQIVEDIELVRQAAKRSGQSYRQLIDELRAQS